MSVGPLFGIVFVGVPDRSVTFQFGESLIERERDQIPVMGCVHKRSAEVRLQLESRSHPTEREVPQPELVAGESGVAASPVEHVWRAQPSLAHLRLVVTEVRRTLTIEGFYDATRPLRAGSPGNPRRSAGSFATGERIASLRR